MSEETYYVKRGRKYVPVKYHDSEITESFPEGATLIIKKGNLRMYRYSVPMELASAAAVLEWLKEELTGAIVSSSAMVAPVEMLTPEHLAAWENFVKIAGPAGKRISYPSAAGVAITAIESLREDILGKMSHPLVKEAYERLQTAIALTENHETQ